MRGAAGGAAEPQNRASQRRIGLFRGRDTRRLVRVTTGPLRASQENHRDSGSRGRDSPASGTTRVIVRVTPSGIGEIAPGFESGRDSGSPGMTTRTIVHCPDLTTKKTARI